MNSIRNVQRAIDFEIERQIAEIEAGKEIISESRQFDTVNFTTHSMRTKEELNDYRYFPEPDLQPLKISDEWLESIRSKMPSLPQQLVDKFVKEYGLPEYDALVITDTKEIALYFEELCKNTKNYKAASNWMMGPVKSYLNELTMTISQLTITPKALAELIAIVDAGKVSFATAASEIFPELIKADGRSALKIAEELNLIQDSNSDNIRPIVESVLAKFPEKVAEYKGGKKGILGMFMGEVKKATNGKADPKVTTAILTEILES